MKKILIVDDEPSILTLLQYNFEKNNFLVTTATNGLDAFQLASKQDFDFLLLDLMLPEINGMEIIKKLREKGITTPAFILTAKEDEVEKIVGIESGADDYIFKPFSSREVIARVNAVLRRANFSEVKEKELDEELILEVGAFKLNLTTNQLLLNAQLIELTKKEFELLYYFMKHVNHTVSREKLLDRVWSFDFDGTTRIVDVHVSHLREKIEDDPKQPKYIITKHGFGYKFKCQE
ncbi:MAG: response regulator transcription factor [Streptococcaceae bacterium]|jgi:two-component system alkaline phosphatase synthesis response regulator PhoP|nr:response regulator transcription factor [Streptococcaceae bacterium]